jgi:putative component of membrane protein insertase Oxa1/YidC/SpoIIIJ protein YidD
MHKIITAAVYVDKKIGLLVSFLVLLYQKTFSPDHSVLFKKKHPFGFCPFYPSCSEYSRLSLVQKGFTIGIFLSFWRVVRCHPWRQPVLDPVKK